jgi:hypothetical protein
MKSLHDICEGVVEEIVGIEGCYDDNYGRCTKCGVEGELIVKDIDETQNLTIVSIQPIPLRHE